ncbi:MAG: outer membrane beta-barrel protein [Hyphomicrobium sp.]
MFLKLKSNLTAVALFSGSIALALVPEAARADDEEMRAAAALAQNQAAKQGAGFVKQIGDARYAWRPYVESEAGFDSNPDNSFTEDGSSFVKLESGMKATLERAKEYYALTLKGRFIDFMQLEGETNRKDFKVAVDTRFDLSDTETFSAGTYFLRDLISVARADIAHSYMDYALRTEDYRLRILGKNHTEHNFDNDARGNETFDDFIVSRSKAFDYSRSDAQINALTFTRNFIQPFAIYDFGHINFYNQTDGASVDRDAIEHFGIAGVRLQFDKSFRVDVGYRLNHRDFDDTTISQDNNGFIDVNVFWQPFDTLKITGVIERYYDESTSSFGLVDDVKSYGATFDWTVMPTWRIAGTTYYDDEVSIGDTVHYNKLTSTLSVSHDVNENLEVFVSGLAKWVDERVTDDSYDRYKIGAGARLQY